MLDGRAEVIAYSKNPSVFYLRVYRKEKKGYDSERIEGVSDLETACLNCLDTYMRIGVTAKPASQVRVRRNAAAPEARSGEGAAVRQPIELWVNSFIKEQFERAEKGLNQREDRRELQVVIDTWIPSLL